MSGALENCLIANNFTQQFLIGQMKSAMSGAQSIMSDVTIVCVDFSEFYSNDYIEMGIL